MANPNIGNVLAYVDYCSDLDYLDQQRKELIHDFNFAGHEQDQYTVLQDDSPLARSHQAYINAHGNVLEMIEIRIEELENA